MAKNKRLAKGVCSQSKISLNSKSASGENSTLGPFVRNNNSRNNKLLLFFLIKFFVIFTIASAIIEFVNLSPLTNLIAFISAGWLGLEAIGSSVLVGGQMFIVTNSCTGLVSASILGAIIFALRKPDFKTKLVLFVWGTIALIAVNVPRIALVLFAAQNGFNAELVHEASWFLMSAVVLIIWYFGTKKLANVKYFGGLV